MMPSILSNTTTDCGRSRARLVFALILCLGNLASCGVVTPTDDSIIHTGSEVGAENTPNNVAIKRFEYRRILMGVEAQIILYAESEPFAREAAGAAFARMDALEAVLSDYRRKSEVNQACRLARDATAERPILVGISGDLAEVIERSRDFSVRSDGAFDITVGRLTKLWRRSRKSGALPSAEELAIHLQSTGYEKLRVDRWGHGHESALLAFLAPEMQLDFGGIGKGYAADAALTVLREEFGITSALVNIGGDLTVGDGPPGKAGWRVQIRTFDSTEMPDETLVIANGAVATSGDLEKYIEIEGVRYSHILDPTTGLGLTRRIAVTVIAGDGTTADALASAVSVLGAVKGLALVESYAGVAVRVVDDVGGDDGGGSGTRNVTVSSGFRVGR